MINISLDLFERLAKLPRIVGVKDATGDLSLPQQLRARVGNDFYQLTGDDATTLPFYAAGGHGCVSVTSNIAPKECVDLHQEFLKGNIAKALEIQDRFTEINNLLFCEANPAPAKYVAELLGICSSELRLPLVEISTENKERIKKALDKAGLK